MNIDKPVLEFYEDGPWLRIEAIGQPIRYLPKKEAKQLLFWLGQNSFSEKSELIFI